MARNWFGRICVVFSYISAQPRSQGLSAPHPKGCGEMKDTGNEVASRRRCSRKWSTKLLAVSPVYIFLHCVQIMHAIDDIYGDACKVVSDFDGSIAF